jgi:hypothetical protein
MQHCYMGSPGAAMNQTKFSVGIGLTAVFANRRAEPLEAFFVGGLFGSR